MSTNDAGQPPRGMQGSPEDQERAAARRRGEEREQERAAGRERPRVAGAGIAPASVTAHAFAALADNVRDYAIFLMNPDGVITFWGEGARLIKWWTKDQTEGSHLRMLYPAGGSDDGTAEEHLRAAGERGEYTGEGERIRSDGSTFWAGITITALRDEDGTLLGFAKVTRDLTARRAADALLQAAAESAESARADAVAASAAKSGFLATMSHEIRTPINAIMGYLELLDLEIEGPLTAGQRRHLARAAASSRHLLSLINEVLDFSRIETEHVALGRSAFRIGDAVGGALALVAPQARARGLEVADAVSGLAAGLAAWGDEARVRQILANLLTNAVKFTAPRTAEGGRAEPGRVTVSAGTATRPSPDAVIAGDGPWIYVRVEDTGAGIPRDRMTAVFEPFVQADMRLTRVHGGTGLGLAISRRLARLMGGDVTARSEEGVGSTFFLWLPAAPVESIQMGGIEAQHAGGAPAQGAGGALRAIADLVLGDLERLLHAYVARVRSDPGTPSAHGTPEAQVEDHMASFLADLAGTLLHLDAAPHVPGAGVGVGAEAGAAAPEPGAAVRDGTAIQRLVAERHGAQRARLGWAEDEVRREFAILGEELTAAVRRRTPAQIDGPTPEARRLAAERALEVLADFLAVAERLSVASHRRDGAGGGR